MPCVSVQARRRKFYAEDVLSDFPLAQYRLGDPDNLAAADSSGNGRTASYAGAVTLGQPGALVGDPDTACGFDGLSGRLITPFVWADFEGLAGLTLSLWAKPASTGAYQTLAYIGNYNQASPNYHWVGLDRLADGTLRFVTYDGTEAAVSAALPAGQWAAIDAVLTATHQHLYVNGELIGSVARRFPSIAGGRQLLFATSRGDQDFFCGALDEISFYPAALSADRVLTRYNAGRGS